MKSIFKPLLISAVLASSAALVQAQTAPTGQGMMHASARGEHGRMDPARMQERMAARMAELKAKLNLNAAQEGGWNDYLAAMQPPAHHQRMSRDERKKMHEEMQAMTTPQRLDRMAAMRAERDTLMRQREQATRNFYDLLSTEQQKVFDANTMMGGGHHGKRGGKGGHRHG
ncbi:MAG: Spy/CpxP family protein refolding chaperone [Burkholderiaceae bacterium]|nr:Spy/CpxP family protein refolding chaperone [Rhodoferax sp.]MCB2006605.1 Spy/CpxP family protein refolding chaperone [Rhodoferax sp.]MCB2028964.1 Spy/CpxP family protein refolding chaperone [Rhodoferax sp.]MCB2040990.1 Spy/CpxP family protein refolding chaperone [Rhodoferax sp.]MCP5260881.1 Spy/CpxP family protein refolding chaperone [Rhodoferax sp.]